MTNPIPYPKEMVLRELFCIRSKKDPDKFFPEVRHGYTHREPTPVTVIPPRLFLSERSAKAFLSQWKLGRHVSCGEDGVEVRAVKGRDPNDYEIIPVAIVFQDYDDT